MPFPLKEARNEKRCKCGHRFSSLFFIKCGLQLQPEGVFALACPECGEPKVITTTSVSNQQAEEMVRKLLTRMVSFEEAEALARERKG